MDNKINQMKEKVKLLNEAARAYYQEDREIMANIEYDRLYDELQELEYETGIILSNSPTIHVGYEVLSNLPKERHERTMLSLDKTKDRTALKGWLGGQTGVLSWKLDGLTIVLSYKDGQLQKAVTRGNGEIGEVVTNNAKVFANLPINIPFERELVLRGEAIIHYSDFEKINQEIGDEAAKYKNPRNLCSGSVRQLNNKITADRKVYFYGFSVVKAEDVDFGNSRIAQMEWLGGIGFDMVEWKRVTANTILDTVEWFEQRIPESDLPSDGLVLTFDDIQYGESLGVTSKFPRDAIAFKWSDEVKETKLIQVEWSASRTGLINPIAVFEPVELEGTTVSRAGVHNISILENLELGIDDTLCVYKANMIIPQISENLTRSGTIKIPELCPACEHETVIRDDHGVKTLYCPNVDCQAKHIKSFTHFVSRDAMGIDGLSEATVEKLIDRGFVKEYGDIFRIGRYKQEIMIMEGFGEKSFQNLMESINRSRKTNPVRLLFSLGIPNIGLSNAKVICKKFSNNWIDIQGATREQLLEINGVGDVMANSFVNFFSNVRNQKILEDLLQEIEFEQPTAASEEMDQTFDGLNFVITGSVEHFKNRNEVKELIEARGGKVSDAVSSKTNYLINNDNQSNSTKNKKAKELGVPIITENQFLDLIR